MKIKKLTRLCLFIALLLPLQAWSTVFQYNPASDVIGQLQTFVAQPGDSIDKYSRQYNVGYYEIIEANSYLRKRKLHIGDKVTIPSQYILPDAVKKGIVINLAELRLYYYDTDANEVLSEPIGIGREGWMTPVSVSKVYRKQADPDWHPPASIRAYMASEAGRELPDVVPAGPDNPLGKYAIYLTLKGYLIHGTNNPASVGKRSSSGCIRMFPEGIETLYQKVLPGAPVTIVNEPYKFGWENDQLYMEVHIPLKEDDLDLDENPDPIVNKIKEIGDKTPLMVNWEKVFETVKQKKGIPVRIGRKASLVEQMANKMKLLDGIQPSTR